MGDNMAEKNQKIKCDVNHCQYNEESKVCTLNEIKVSKCDCGCDGKKENTLCGSYECRK
jgi:hypothetical protein